MTQGAGGEDHETAPRLGASDVEEAIDRVDDADRDDERGDEGGPELDCLAVDDE